MAPRGEHVGPGDHGSPPKDRHPKVSRKIGSRFLQWSDAESGSLGSRYIGKVLIDCKFRFGESRWGTLGASKTPAGVIYIDLGFNQPKQYRLASATVQVSLEEYGMQSSDKGKMTDHEVASRLAVTDQFGPRMLTGKPTTRSGTTTANFTPEVGFMGMNVGGIGVSTEKTVTYSSQWVVNGHLVAGTQYGVPDATYKTLKWELSENDFSPQPLHSNVVHAGLAFTHEAKPFYIKVEIKGKLRKVSDRLRFRFPPKLHRDQGTAFTLVELGPEHQSGPPLEPLARTLEETMVRKNLYAVPREIPDSLPLSTGETKAVNPPEPSDINTTGQAIDAAPHAATDKSSTSRPRDPTQPCIAEMLSQALSEYPISEKTESAQREPPSFVAGLSREVPEREDIVRKHVRTVEEDVPRREDTVRKKARTVEEEVQRREDIVSEKVRTVEEQVRRLSAYPAVLILLHWIAMVVDLFESGRREPKAA